MIIHKIAPIAVYYLMEVILRNGLANVQSRNGPGVPRECRAICRIACEKQNLLEQRDLLRYVITY